MEAEAGGSPAAEREDGRKWNGCPCGESVHLLWVLLRGRKWQRVQLPAAEREEQGSGGGSVLSWEETPVSDTPVLFFIPPVGNHVIVKDCSFLLTQ